MFFQLVRLLIVMILISSQQELAGEEATVETPSQNTAIIDLSGSDDNSLLSSRNNSGEWCNVNDSTEEKACRQGF